MASGGHVLIIEDEMLIGIDVLNCLATLGFDTFAFASAQAQALEQARLRRPDLVTIDVGLLDGDGLSAADALMRGVRRYALHLHHRRPSKALRGRGMRLWWRSPSAMRTSRRRASG